MKQPYIFKCIATCLVMLIGINSYAQDMSYQYVSPIPKQAKEVDFSYGFFAGVGGDFTTGSLKNYFSNSLIFTAGLEANFSSCRLKADFQYGQPNLNKLNMYGVYDEDGRDAQVHKDAPASRFGVGASFGYTMLSIGRFDITPFAGILFTRYSWSNDNLKWELNSDTEEYEPTILYSEKAKESSVMWRVGIDFDITLSRSESANINGNALQSAIRVTPYVARGTFNKNVDGMRGITVGLTVSYSGLFTN